MFVPVLVLMSLVALSELTSFGLAFLASQRGVDTVSLPGLRVCDPGPGHSWVSTLHEISTDLGLEVPFGLT